MKNRVIHIGDKGQYERTDPDYVDKRLAQMVKDYDECPESWRGCFVVGLSQKDRRDLEEYLSNR